jgi:enamine deaminase RidA (YjgF/YER057c/UK114 family)
VTALKRTHLDPPELPDWSSLFSQVVVTEGSRLRIVAVSGQVGVDARQRVCGDGSLVAQIDGAFRNLQVALSAAGSSAADVVKITIYVVEYSPEKAAPIQEAVRRHLGDPPLPACSLVGVQALARPEFQVEVEALAVTEGSGS